MRRVYGDSIPARWLVDARKCRRRALRPRESQTHEDRPQEHDVGRGAVGAPRASRRSAGRFLALRRGGLSEELRLRTSVPGQVSQLVPGGVLGASCRGIAVVVVRPSFKLGRLDLLAIVDVGRGKCVSGRDANTGVVGAVDTVALRDELL